MNEKIRKLVRTNTVLYMLLLLAFAGVTVKVSPILAVCEVGAAMLVWYVSYRRSKLMQQQLHQYAFPAGRTPPRPAICSLPPCP